MEIWAFDQWAGDHGFLGLNGERFAQSTKEGPGSRAAGGGLWDLTLRQRKAKDGAAQCQTLVIFGVISRRPYGTPQFPWNAYPGLRPLRRTPGAVSFLPNRRRGLGSLSDCREGGLQLFGDHWEQGLAGVDFWH